MTCPHRHIREINRIIIHFKHPTPCTTHTPPVPSLPESLYPSHLHLPRWPYNPGLSDSLLSFDNPILRHGAFLAIYTHSNALPDVFLLARCLYKARRTAILAQCVCGVFAVVVVRIPLTHVDVFASKAFWERICTTVPKVRESTCWIFRPDLAMCVFGRLV